jgi:hypothetical protein
MSDGMSSGGLTVGSDVGGVAGSGVVGCGMVAPSVPGGSSTGEVSFVHAASMVKTRIILSSIAICLLFIIIELTSVRLDEQT